MRHFSADFLDAPAAPRYTSTNRPKIHERAHRVNHCRALGGVMILLAAGALSGGMARAASAKEPLSLKELERVWTRPTAVLPAAPGPTSSSRIEAISALGFGRGADRCATPLLIALSQRASRLNQPTRKLLEQVTGAPSSGTPKRLFTADGEFLIHYWTDPGSPDAVEAVDDDRDGLPDGVERISSELTDVLADCTHVLEWPLAPNPARSRRSAVGEPVEVFLIRLDSASGGAEGFTAPVLPAPERLGPIEVEPPEGAAAAIYLDARLASRGAASRVAVTHQVAHLVQIRDSVRESPWCTSRAPYGWRIASRGRRTSSPDDSAPNHGRSAP